jgi:hypothetical protein
MTDADLEEYEQELAGVNVHSSDCLPQGEGCPACADYIFTMMSAFEMAVLDNADGTWSVALKVGHPQNYRRDNTAELDELMFHAEHMEHWLDDYLTCHGMLVCESCRTVGIDTSSAAWKAWRDYS